MDVPRHIKIIEEDQKYNKRFAVTEKFLRFKFDSEQFDEYLDDLNYRNMPEGIRFAISRFYNRCFAELLHYVQVRENIQPRDLVLIRVNIEGTYKKMNKTCCLQMY